MPYHREARLNFRDTDPEPPDEVLLSRLNGTYGRGGGSAGSRKRKGASSAYMGVSKRNDGLWRAQVWPGSGVGLSRIGHMCKAPREKCSE